MSRALRGIAGMVCRSIRTIAMQPLRRAVRRRAETQALLSMNDRVLADIGLLRADLQGMAYGIIPAGQGTPEPAREPALAIDLAAERPALALTDRLCEAA